MRTLCETGPCSALIIVSHCTTRTGSANTNGINSHRD